VITTIDSAKIKAEAKLDTLKDKANAKIDSLKLKSAEKMEEAANGFLFTHKLMDYSIVLIMVGLIIGIGYTSYKISTSAIFFIVMFTTGIFYGFISYIFNYLFQEIITQPIFSTVLVHFPRTIMICKNLHWVMLIEIIVASITLYAKRGRGQYLS
jgi:F0F1-type ATP synthase assembly protein I